MKHVTVVSALMLVGLATPVLASPGAMSVATFLAKADALEAKGLGALASPDLKLLRAEAGAAGKAYRAMITADKRAGRAPHSCPPEKASVTSKQLLAHLRTYAVVVRQKTTITMAIFGVMKLRYPCS